MDFLMHKHIRMPSKPMVPASNLGAKWNYDHDGFFIELMMKQVSRRIKGQWWDEWRNILSELNNRIGVRFQLQELRSRQHWLKKYYFICKALLSHSGFSWDDVLHKVTADGQAWDEYTREHPDAKPFRWMSFPYYKKLACLFEGTSAEGLYATHSCQQETRSTSTRTSQQAMVACGRIDPNEDINREKYISLEKEKLNEVKSIKGNARTHLPHSMNVTSSMTDTLVNPTDERVTFFRCMQELQKLETELTLEEISQAASHLKEEKNAIAFLTFSGPLRLCFIRSLLE